MFTVDLKCVNDHEFEGWYQSRGEYQSLKDSDEITCPLCESNEVQRVLTTGGVKTSKSCSSHPPHRHEIVGVLVRVEMREPVDKKDIH